jgi:hypothetical protein
MYDAFSGLNQMIASLSMLHKAFPSSFRLKTNARNGGLLSTLDDMASLASVA